MRVHLESENSLHFTRISIRIVFFSYFRFESNRKKKKQSRNKRIRALLQFPGHMTRVELSMGEGVISIYIFGKPFRIQNPIQWWCGCFAISNDGSGVKFNDLHFSYLLLKICIK